MVADRVHVALFRHGMSPDMVRFLGHLSWSAAGGIVAAAVMFTATVVAGRLLGPTEYGKVSLVLVLSQAFALLGAFGFDVACARTVPRATPDGRRGLVSTAVPVVLLTLCGSSVVGIAFAAPVAALLGTTRDLVVVAVVAGVLLGVRTVLDRQASALERFRDQLVVRIVDASVALVVVVVVVGVLDHRTWPAVVLALNVATVVLIALYVLRLRDVLAASAVSRTSFRRLVPYARIATLHAITPIGFVYGDRLVVQDQLGPATLGVYTAYYMASYTVVALALGVTTNVLFPASARLDDKAPLLDKLDRLRALATVPVTVALMGVTYVVLALFGREYPFSATTAALFGVWGAMLLFNGLYTVVTVTHSERTHLLTALQQGGRSAAFLAYLAVIVAVGATSIRTVLAGMVLIEILEALNLRMIIRRHVVPARR